MKLAKALARAYDRDKAIKDICLGGQELAWFDLRVYEEREASRWV